jgi:hypothetical protein
MFKKSLVRIAGPFGLPVMLAWTLAACSSGNRGGSGSNSGAPTASGANEIDSGSDQADATITTGSDDSGAAMGPGAPDAASNMDATANALDGGVYPDTGPRDIGSCCSEQTTPGCSNPDLEVCVCEKDQSCCTTAWSLPCVLIVQQKYCQPGVRDCVCGVDAGQWGQTQCCNTDWTSTCDSVATLKCSAVQGCF